jgi:Na+/H+ antiporter NhaD/arsenite permease-like protein
VSPETAAIVTGIIFVVVYLGLAIGRLPLLHLDRAGIALVGATAMLVLNLVSFDDAVRAIDYPTIALLFGMMVVVAYLRLGGFFRAIASWVLARVQSPHRVLATVVALSGVLSAFLVNDVVCLALGPIVLRLAWRLRRSPVPFLVALATAANAGSVATVTGNPQNMILGALSRIPFATFAARLAPVAAAALVVDYLVIAVVFRRALSREEPAPESDDGEPDPAGPPSPELLPKGVAVLLGAVGLFFAGAPSALVALGAGALLMLGRVRPERLYAQIDWNLLVMFAGLFVVVHGFEVHVVAGWNIAQRLAAVRDAPVVPLSLASAALSNVVSNVPAVLLLKSVVTSLPAAARTTAWLTLAMASTLSGNLSPLASVANLIVIERAHREGVRLTVWDYCAVGIPVTLLTLAGGTAWLMLNR